MEDETKDVLKVIEEVREVRGIPDAFAASAAVRALVRGGR